MIKEFILAPGISVKKFSTIKSPPNPLKTRENKEAPNKIKKVIGIFKAYCTRVGSGPFTTELLDDIGKEIQKIGHEFGSTTGRSRRCGWLDLPALKYATMINGITELVITKVDVLSHLEKIKV